MSDIFSKLLKSYLITEFDRNGKEIHSKSIVGEEEWEEWKEYDSNGNLIHYKSNYGIELLYEYTFWENGKIKKECRVRTFC